MGNQNATAAPSGTFDAADGPLNIAANQQEQFETLCRLVDRLDLVTDPRFADREARKQHRDQLNDELNRALAGRTALDWEQTLSAAGVPAARILSVPQAVALDQLHHRGFFTELPHPDRSDRRLRVTGNGVQINGQPPRPTDPPPLLGQHNHEREALLARWLGQPGRANQTLAQPAHAEQGVAEEATAP
jgi:crotonobetainyl-CoA:carnitine CoA-transferase CaiB-like acyl-CoA transferase